MHTAETLLAEHSSLEVEIATEKLRKYKLIKSTSNKEELPQQWKESILVPIQKRLAKLTVVIIKGQQYYQYNFFSIFLSHG
jgi:hypothetical protein